MVQFGILTKQITQSQHGMLIVESLNGIVNDYYDLSPILFYETYPQMVVNPQFAMIQHREAWLFDGPIITTSLEYAQVLLTCPKPSPKFLYLWNLDWLYIKQPTLSYLEHIYLNDNLQLIARSKTHAKIIENCWKKPVLIIEDFDHHELAKLIRATGKNI